MRFKFIGLGLLCAAVLGDPAAAQQSRIPDIDEAKKLFFHEIYFSGGFTLYCGSGFGIEIRRNGVVEKPLGLVVAHVYSPSWMKTITACTANMDLGQCRRSSRRFRIMESDLHNLYPALGFVNADRGTSLFGSVPRERKVFEACDYEHNRRSGVVEPRPESRGNIARAIMYMHSEYSLPVSPAMRAPLMRWHRADPVSQREQSRNDQIQKVQGTRNPYIDNPVLANKLRWAGK